MHTRSVFAFLIFSGAVTAFGGTPQTLAHQPRPLARRVMHSSDQFTIDGMKYRQSYEMKFRWRGDGAYPLQAGLAKPLAVVAADFDGDRVKDLAALHDYSGRAVLALYRGIAAHPGPGTGEQVVSPFEEEAETILLPGRADLLLSGDFNGDSRADILVAERGANGFWFLENNGLDPDGHTAFHDPKWIELEGAITALAGGEINFRDGMEDVLFGIDGGRLTVFSSPYGAMRAQPFTLGLPLPQIDALSTGDFNGDGAMDIGIIGAGRTAVAWGSNSGSPMRVARLETTASAPATPLMTRLLFPHIPGLTYAGFTGKSSTLTVAAITSGFSFQVNDANDEDDPNAGAPPPQDDGICNSGPVSQNGTPLGGCSYRAAVRNLNLLAGIGGTITFAPFITTINNLHGTAPLTVPAVIDGTTTNQGFVTFDCSQNPAAHGVELVGGDPGRAPTFGRVVRGIHTVNCDAGIVVRRGGSTAYQFANNAIIVQNKIQNTSQKSFGILSQVAYAVIGDSTPGMGNTVDNVVEGIVAGTSIESDDATNQTVIGNRVTRASTGIHTAAISAKVGGTNPGEGNVVDASVKPFGDAIGILAQGEPTLIQGNMIGNDGTKALLSKGVGVRMDANFVQVGGVTASARNIISGNPLDGINVNISNSGKVLGNYIGTDASGLVAIPNGIGVRTNSVMTVSGNVISGNSSHGLVLSNGATVQGNLIGLNAAGNAALANLGHGVVSGSCDQCKIGGDQPGEGNVISGNARDGLNVSLGSITVSGNKMGTDITGSFAVPNGGNGISVSAYSGLTISNNIVGGNTADGIVVDSCCAGNTIQNNYVGTNPAGAAIGNGGNGVTLLCCLNTVAGNTIWNNGGAGINASSHQTLLRNSIFNNGGLGIQIANNFLPPPVIANASSMNGATVVQGSITFNQSDKNLVEFYSSPACDRTGSGEGKTYLGAATNITNSFTFNAPMQLAAGSVITAVHVVPSFGVPTNSTQFSACFAYPSHEPLWRTKRGRRIVEK